MSCFEGWQHTMNAHKADGQLWQERGDGDAGLLLLLRRIPVSAAAAACRCAAAAAAAGALPCRARKLLVVNAVLLKQQQQVFARHLERVRHCQAAIIEVHRWQRCI